MGKISHGVWGGGPSIIFNFRKIDLKFVFCYIRPYNVFRKLPITHLFSIESKKKNAGLYDHGTCLKTKFRGGHLGFLTCISQSILTKLGTHI